MLRKSHGLRTGMVRAGPSCALPNTRALRTAVFDQR